MKKLIKYIFLVIGITTVSSCDDGFDELNTNKIAVTAIDPIFMLNQALISTSYPTETAVFDMGVVQQIISPNSGVLTGANFNQENRAVFGQLWPQYFQNVIRNTKIAIKLSSEQENRGNLVQMARIVQAHAFMVLSDRYGEIPYSEAGIGFLEGVVLPTYDTQEFIYKDIIKELTEASASLNASGKSESADILYKGDISKWKKLGYSLLLRAGMRLSQVDAAAAKSAVSAAFSGGVMASNDDNFAIVHDANYQNAIGGMLNSTEANNFFIPKPFIDQLKNTNDPRLAAIAVRYVGASSGPGQTEAVANRNADVQIGIPMGNDNSGAIAAAVKDGLSSFYAYSQIDRTRMAKNTAPMFFVTHAQTQLLIAEAISRGYLTGSAETYFSNGIKAHMDQMALFSAASAIESEKIQKYISDNPLSTNALEQIGIQYWIASLMNGPEAFANFRRTGFPKLVANPYPLKDIKGDFINRITYPNSEISVNSTNIQAAIGRQGADNLDTKVWWNK
ncbi:SusD/RagB family nutrient-binding outer membrane lipoprotein [Lacihabitans sp. LS3-19]|uniref:SusD/RagB family nutrient-binding outer membrane lipoprotein n=1 Tax=Lacihabitans sp. LS3-19 TaxID=2487335 RepID=UPI0020CC5BEA|nr:SusD/RagB family nutrient-binding outer membrane lipoprotein [Lacihabitans sp. LS3-19]MCP9768373.1 SusD/RagB family nutrient-binding outer membrane lipoprotein [Lacihabitans sp. LS3-19]